MKLMPIAPPPPAFATWKPIIAQARAETAKQAELWTVCPRKLPSLYPHTDEDMERIEITL